MADLLEDFMLPYLPNSTLFEMCKPKLDLKNWKFKTVNVCQRKVELYCAFIFHFAKLLSNVW